MKSTSFGWRWFFILAALEAGAAFCALLLVPHEQGGYSLSRLAMIFLLSATFVLWIALAFRTPGKIDALTRPVYSLGFALISLLLAAALFFLRYLDPERLLPFYQRLSPVFWYFLALCLQFSLQTLRIRFGLHPRAPASRQSIVASALVAFCILLATFLFIAITRIGLIPDGAYWGEPGVPLIGWQLGLALLGGLCVIGVGLRAPLSRRFDIAAVLVIWLLAVGIWLSVPVSVMQNSFYAPMNPPTNQPFPNSDAGYYDSMAQSLLVGYPYQGDIPTRPLYVVFLTALHLLVGERYGLIIAGQTLVLALIPVVFYFLGKKLHSRAAGVIIALFAIFREWTSLLISSQTRVSNTKTLLVDLPTLLLLALACLLAMRWLERKDRGSALAAGGMFGLLLLLRTQSVLILPMLFLLVLFALGLRTRSFAIGLAFFLGGLAIAVVPWLLHNFLRTGQLTFEAPFEVQVIASQYRYTGNLDIANMDLQGKSLFGILLTFALQDPKFVLGFIATHFFATQVNSVLALPLIEPYTGLLAPLNLYWLRWDGRLDWFNVVLIIVYLSAIALGLGAAWRRWRWMGLTPLAFSLGYSLANGIARFSGWRYDLPADWIAYFYFGIGVAELFAMLALFFGAKDREMNGPTPSEPFARQRWIRLTIVAGIFLLIGVLPWIAEGLAQPRYADQSLATLISRLSSSAATQRLNVSQAQIETFAATPQATLQIGRVLYPRFFSHDTGLASAHPWPAYAPRDFPRLGFLLLNQTRHDALIPTRQLLGEFLDGADAIVLGCQRPDHIEVRLILFPDSDTAYLSRPLADPCN